MGGFRRVLLKLSGQSLAGPQEQGIHPPTLSSVADEIAAVRGDGRQIAIVIGAGNIFRGLSGAEAGTDRVLGDQMGMLATVFNCLALADALHQKGVGAQVLSAFEIATVCDPFRRDRALAAFERGDVLLLGGGTGNPFFTTDTAAALRAAELDADALLKATRVDGVYDRDPEKHPDAKRWDRLGFTEVIERNLRVMDTAAFAICRDNQIPIQVFDLHVAGNIRRAAAGEAIGTLVEPEPNE